MASSHVVTQHATTWNKLDFKWCRKALHWGYNWVYQTFSNRPHIQHGLFLASTKNSGTVGGIVLWAHHVDYRLHSKACWVSRLGYKYPSSLFLIWERRKTVMGFSSMWTCEEAGYRYFYQVGGDWKRGRNSDCLCLKLLWVWEEAYERGTGGGIMHVKGPGRRLDGRVGNPREKRVYADRKHSKIMSWLSVIFPF